MKAYYFDHFEFDSQSSEETLIIVVAQRSQFNELTSFLRAVDDLYGFEPSNIGEPLISSQEFVRRSFVGRNLERVGVTDIESMQVGVITDQWNELCLVLIDDVQYVFHFWDTSS